MKILKSAVAIVACISIFYIIGGYVLLQTGFSFRMWVDVSGKILTGLVLPFLILLLVGKCFYLVAKVKPVVKILINVAVSVAYCYWAGLVLLFIIFTVPEERMLTPHLLVVNEAEFLGASKYVYYRPVAFLFKVPGELTDEMKVEYLEAKYDRDFGITGEGSSQEKKSRIYDEKFPQTDVAVYGVGMELEDNYVQVLSQKYLEEGRKAYGITRDYYVSEDNRGYSGWLYMELKDEADIEAFAGDASLLINYVLGNTDFFEDYRGVLGFYCGEGDEKITGVLPFGKLSQWDDVPEEYYFDSEQVADRVLVEYTKGLAFRKRTEEERQKYEDILQGEGEIHGGTESSGDLSSGVSSNGEQNAEDFGDGNQIVEAPESRSPLETAAQLIYDEMLAENGYSYEVKYNAKGNLYIDLGSRPAGEAEDKSSTGYYRFTLVYDRPSKNGVCELFVLYKEHYAETGVNGGNIADSTAILDMYAVETATQKVIAADKQSWSDVGTEAYREATGE